jgi:hypothetical protein
MNVGGWDQGSGLGTLKLVFNPGAAGSYFFDVFLDHQLSIPFFNEYGVANGTPVAGQSWEIGDSFASSIYNDVLAGGTLPDTNNLPGTSSNYVQNPPSAVCQGATCNGDLAMAMGFSFTLTSGQEEAITLTTSHSPLGGFSLEGIHPVDPANSSETLVFFTGTATTQPVGHPTIPEPGSLLLLGTVSTIIIGGLRRRLRPVKPN